MQSSTVQVLEVGAPLLFKTLVQQKTLRFFNETLNSAFAKYSFERLFTYFYRKGNSLLVLCKFICCICNLLIRII